ncbi:hypothetical protein HYV30_03455 [Candidatus Kaiserbacteria bacterium]|nr:hypothetical protein [Candidatus Kaiserbacteria bacterium]
MKSKKECGSTLIVYDLYLDKRSNARIALSPKLLHKEVSKIIAEVNMHRRTGVLDVWESKEAGPATSFHSLEESHNRLSVINFARAETWPKEMHINGEAQLCNYSRDNTRAARLLVRRLIERLDPARANILLIGRGPGPMPRVLKSFSWKRGLPLPL